MDWYKSLKNNKKHKKYQRILYNIFMIYIICGEDSINSYNYYLQLKKNYQQKNYQIFDINFNQLEDIYQWLGESLSLFNEKKVFFSQNLNKKINKKNQKIINIINQIINDKNIKLISWEEAVNSKYLKYPKGIIIKEFKPIENIFKLQESLYPGNLNNFLNLLNKVSETENENFIFTMLIKHVRNLILVANRQTKKANLKDWQIYKLENQTKKWDYYNLISFYQSLYQIELKTKTSTNPLDIIKLLQIITSYYL